MELKVTTTIEAKPCPFCGAEATLDFASNGDMIDLEVVVRCTVSLGGCGAKGGYSVTEEGAMEAWNERRG